MGLKFAATPCASISAGRGELCREPLPGAATEKNIEHAKRLATIINYEIEAGTFDYARHFPDSRRLAENRFGHYLDLWLAIKKKRAGVLQLSRCAFQG